MIVPTQMNVSTNKSVSSGFGCDWPSSSEAIIGSGLTQVFVQSLISQCINTTYSTWKKRTRTLLTEENKKYNQTYCFRPFSISLIRSCEKLPAQEHFIVQEYLDKPFLLEGYKFDLRIYILVTTCDPLRIFLYNDGLVRMGTEKYHAPNEANLVS